MVSIAPFVCLVGFLFLWGEKVAHSDEGVAMQDSDKGNAISVAVASNGSGKALLLGRRYLPSINKYVGWIKQVDVSTGLGDSQFNAADDNSSNINVTVAPPDAGSIYFDFAGAGKENLCTTAVWKSPKWWIACRSSNSSSKYILYLASVTLTGDVTAYSTSIGGGSTLNKHGYPGHQGSLLVDGNNLIVVGYRGTGVSNPTNTSNDYRPFMAKFNLSQAQNLWSPTYLTDFTGTDNDSSTGAYNYRAVALIKGPVESNGKSYYY
jgi:hypothetical protein